MAAAIECRDLRKTYEGKVEAVRGLNLEIEAGECFGLLGPNGAGKTTTIEILEGLLAPTSGQVTILGKTWKQNERELREVMGISLQETKLSEKLTVIETIKLFSSFYRQPRAPVEVLDDCVSGGGEARVDDDVCQTARRRISEAERDSVAVMPSFANRDEVDFIHQTSASASE